MQSENPGGVLVRDPVKIHLFLNRRFPVTPGVVYVPFARGIDRFDLILAGFVEAVDDLLFKIVEPPGTEHPHGPVRKRRRRLFPADVFRHLIDSFRFVLRFPTGFFGRRGGARTRQKA